MDSFEESLEKLSKLQDGQKIVDEITKLGAGLHVSGMGLRWNFKDLAVAIDHQLQKSKYPKHRAALQELRERVMQQLRKHL